MDEDLKGYRFGIGAALVALIVTCLGLGMYVGAVGLGERGHDQATEQSQQAAQPKAAAPEEPRGEPGNPPCEQGEDNRESDLCAQWKAADAAAKSATWTEETYQLGVWGLRVGFLTFLAALVAALYARKAAHETGKGATAALEAVEATREANRISARAASHQLRAYIGTTEARAFYIGHALPRIVIQLRNFGQTPAYGVVCTSRIYLDAQLTGAPPEDDTEIPFTKELGIVEPGAEPYLFIELPEKWLSKNRDGMNSGGLRLAAETRIDYTDIDREPRWRTFTYYYVKWPGNPTKGALMRISPTGNEAN